MYMCLHLYLYVYIHHVSIYINMQNCKLIILQFKKKENAPNMKENR